MKMAQDSRALDRDLEDLPPEMRWREWMKRIEAVIFASGSPVPREHLARVVGQDVSVDLLIEDLKAELQSRPYDLVRVADGWILRTRSVHAAAIRAAADVEAQQLDLTEFEAAVLGAIAWHQPMTRDELKAMFGREINRDLIGRLRQQDLITIGPRSPRKGAPHTFVTTNRFLVAFDLQSLRDLPDRDAIEDMGLIDS